MATHSCLENPKDGGAWRATAHGPQRVGRDWATRFSLSKLLPSFPGGSVIKKKKNPPASAGDPGSTPGMGRSPGEGNGNPLQYSCLGNPMDRGTWWATVCGVTKSRAGLSQQTTTTKLLPSPQKEVANPSTANTRYKPCLLSEDRGSLLTGLPASTLTQRAVGGSL